MNRRDFLSTLLRTMLLCTFACLLVGCSSTADSAQELALANGSYPITVETDSSMFHAEYCTLVVEDGSYTAVLSLPGEGFSRLYFGTAADAAEASDDQIIDYYLNDEDKYTFDVPLEEGELDVELTVAAFGHRRDTWYDHTITFHTPDEEVLADAA